MMCVGVSSVVIVDRSHMCAYFKQLVVVIMRGDGEVMVTCCVVLCCVMLLLYMYDVVVL